MLLRPLIFSALLSGGVSVDPANKHAEESTVQIVLWHLLAGHPEGERLRAVMDRLAQLQPLPYRAYQRRSQVAERGRSRAQELLGKRVFVKRNNGPETVHQAPVTATACSADGELFASGDDDGCIAIWDAISGELLARHRPQACENGPITRSTGHTGPVAFLWFSEKSRRLVSASSDGTCWVRDATSLVALANELFGDPTACDGPQPLASFSSATGRIALGYSGVGVVVLDVSPLGDSRPQARRCDRELLDEVPPIERHG